MKLVYKKQIGKNGKPFDCIAVDLGYSTEILTFNSAVCANVMGVSQKELAALPVPTERVLLTNEAAKK